LFAQNARGSINGLVRDSTGAVIPGAVVQVLEQNTGARYSSQTQSDGAYLVPNLLPGVYRVSGEAKGFKHLNVEGLQLDVGTTLTQNLTLEVGAVTDAVTVTGTTSLVEQPPARWGLRSRWITCSSCRSTIVLYSA
jgi:hypothetical protein